MKITVIGSTGRTGMHVLEQGIRRGHELTAFTRRPQLLENITGLNNIVAGDALHVSHLKKAIENQEAVIAIVGDRQTPVASESTKCLIQAMQECNVHRLVCVSSYLLGSTRPRGITPFFQWLLRHSLSDRLSADQLIISSKTDWTIVRATRLHDKPATGNVRLQKSGLEFESGPYGICRADLASVLLDTVTNKASINSIINATWGRNK
ncbi:NAD(P)-dependent oxidoreductase [Paenibacillus lautus]|uniref:NAD(P)-dependent oxidoreductase n=1 Tax=Paenibacillus lautus TaxID=1401 RepID=UPI002DBE37AD|nr:NAD(P)-binding oxidoreductase [Paenibacillus lautus]MEC0256779.1 SDR family oxidoreductase [Paenibacillus lautus]